MNHRIKVEKIGPILEPTRLDFERKAVLNPGCYQEGEYVHLFYRAVDRDHHSSIGYAKLKGPVTVVERFEKPFLAGSGARESCGIEDPRITKLGREFFMTYVAHDCKNALISYATSPDLARFRKQGVISPKITYDEAAKIFSAEKLKDRYFLFEAYYEENAGKDVLVWEKDASLFPRKIKGKYAMLHRILPDMHVVYFDDFADLKRTAFWKTHLKELHKHVVLENKFWFESRNVGGGAPPIETPEGWLLIYHAVEELNRARIYHAGAALLDRRNPTKAIGRLDYPLFSPEEPWEKKGYVKNVVFPTGTALFGNDLYIYYGAADRVISAAKVNLKKLLKELKKRNGKQ